MARAEAARGTPAMEPPTPSGLTPVRVKVIFVGLILTILMSALDQTVVATALPTIAGDLHGLSRLSWVITAYLLASTVTMPLYGKVGDLVGRKNVLVFSVVLFLVGSMLSGLSASMDELIGFRALQGIGAGGIMIGAQAIIGEIVSARERGRYMSVMVPMIGVATVIGPLLGGFLTQDASWRWIFYINLPVGALALTVIGLGLHLPAREVRKPVIDYWGASLLATGASGVVVVLSLGGTTWAWGSWPVILVLAAASALLVAWVVAERRAPEPVLPLHLFRNPIFRVSIGVAFAVGFAMIGAVSYLPTFLQLVHQASASDSGILLLPLVAGLMGASVLTGQLISRTGRYKIFPILGTTFAAAGLYLLSTMGARTTTLQSSVYMIVLGIGIGLIMPVLTLAVQNSVPFGDLGVATSGVNFFRQIGGSVGVALAGALFTGRLTDELAARLPRGASGAGAHTASLTPTALEHLPDKLRTIYVDAFAHALPPVFVYFVPVLLAAFALAWFLIEKPLGTESHASAAAAQRPVGAETGTATAVAETEASRREGATPGARDMRRPGAEDLDSGYV